MLKILIADDSEMLGDLFAEYLESVGFTVTGTARTLGEALTAAERTKPDAAVLDYCLGSDLGTEFVTRIVGDRRPAVLYLSGKPLEHILTQADGEAFVQKPISLSDLALRVRPGTHDARAMRRIRTMAAAA
ncbi:MAG TPA: response regulator [Bosea sp. (in: a-proteobacteria)]|jgi:DNA-binding response OmpR family regulator|uniref:response regulator n=1 Tax=Bosea sp. (in: a-proteobacteria) TaxID=1871050 RepID=UPI002DDD1D53|nr:response regulator [Bosea sp. (in: a-proteobacteria)]HEV2554459.1 response regulator [Bosea sp. (in: a-proteobacteria)]